MLPTPNPDPNPRKKAYYHSLQPRPAYAYYQKSPTE